MVTHNTHTHDHTSSGHAEPHLHNTTPEAHYDQMTTAELLRLLRDIMAQKAWTQDELAKELNVSQPTVARWFKGAEPRWPNRVSIIALARLHNVIDNTYALEDVRGIPFVGYVGAGGQVIFSDGQGPFGTADMPPVPVPPQTVALKVQGDSMSPQLEDGWSVYYDTRHSKPTEALTNRLCVVGLTDGRVLVKTLLPGRSSGSWDLHSKNASPLFDQRIEWAARVTFIAPSK